MTTRSRSFVSSSLSLLAALLLEGPLTGCGAAGSQLAFGHRFPDNRPEHIRRVLRALPPPTLPEGPSNPSGSPLLVATTQGAQRAVLLFDLREGRVLWRRPLEAMTRPQILGDVVLTSDREHIVAFDLRTGEPLWRTETNGLPLLGGARTAGVLVYVSSVGAAGGATRAGHIVAVDPRTGTERWSFSIQGVLGRPAALGPFFFVPWDRQNLVVLDAITGAERARLLLSDDVLDWTFADSTGVYYGGRSIYRFSERSASGRRARSDHIEIPVPDAPREPLPFDPGFLPAPGTRSARGRIRFYFAPSPPTEEGTPLHPLGDRYYLAYFRYVFAFGTDGTLIWARALPHDVLRAQATATGVLVVPEQGEAVLLAAADGSTRWKAELPDTLASAELDAVGIVPGEIVESAPPLREALAAIAADADNRLVPARAFAIQRLARMPEPEITRTLIETYERRAMPRALKRTIAEVLRERKEGTEFLVQALERHFDFLEGSEVPPLELLVPAIEAHRIDAALPQLVAHLRDPATPRLRIPLLARAIARLGGPKGAEALMDVVRLYRADSSLAAPISERELPRLFPLPWVPASCYARAQASHRESAEQKGEAPPPCPERERPNWLQYLVFAIFEHAPTEAREALAALAKEPGTDPRVSAALDALLARERAEQAARERAEQAARERAEQAARERAERNRPLKLSRRHIAETFAEHADAFRKCIVQELERSPHLLAVRFAFIVEHDGTPRDFQITPPSEALRDCLAPVLAKLRFPPFKLRRQRASFAIGIRGEARPQDTVEEAAKPWWALSAAHPGPTVGEHNPPWWRPGARKPPTTPQPSSPSESRGSEEGAPWWMEQGAASSSDAREDAPRASSSAEEAPREEARPSEGGSSSPPSSAPSGSEEHGAEKDEEEPPRSGSPREQEPPPPREEDPWWLPTQSSE